MDPITIQMITSIATSYFTQFSTPVVENFFKSVFRLKPELENRLQSAQTTIDIEDIFREAIGVIDANAGEGTIEVDRTLLEAIRGIRFDHRAGLVTISGSTVSAPVLITGGGVGAISQTDIKGETELKSRGTSIKLSGGSSIKIKGSAQIKQT